MSSRSGGIDGRPVAEYNASNVGDILVQTVVGELLDALERVPLGHHLLGDMRHSTDACFMSAPRMTA